MSLAENASLTVEFEGATVVPLADISSLQRAYRIGWFVPKVDVDAASSRYRCLHFAHALRPLFHSVYLTSLSDVQSAVHDLDAIIIVKRLDRTVLDVVGVARLFDVPVFLDLCDDLIAPGYSKNDFGTNLLHFLGIAPFLAGVTASSAEMADRLEGYARENGCSRLSVHVVPDIAETREIYEATSTALRGRTPSQDDEPAKVEKAEGLKQVLWFGNFGSSHSNFGMYTLRPLLKALRNVHSEIPLQLVVVSNNEAVYNALVNGCGFPTHYVAWSRTSIYAALETADATLLTTGDDEFCSIKSSNRVLQSLAAGVPVITAKSASVAEFEDVIFSGPIDESLRLCLGPARERSVPPRMAAARELLKRYTPERIAAIWASLLERAIDDRRSSPKRRPSRVLIVAEPDDDTTKIKALMSTAKNLRGLDYELLVSTELIEQDPRASSALAMSRRVPRFFSGRLKEARNLLIGHSAVIVERPNAPVAKLLSGFAAQLGVRLLTTQEALAGGLANLAARARPAPADSSSKITAGPYAEWSRADGSVDWAFVVHQNARGWILDAICREIGSRQAESWKVFYYPQPAGPARNYFFSHYLLLQNYLERHQELLDDQTKLFVWYTHPREENPASIAKLLLAFDKVTKVIFACESNRQLWLDRGLAYEKTAVVLGAADPQQFKYHERGEGAVGLSSSFYERKSPDRLLEIVKQMPHRQFVLLGRKWNQYALFEEMRALPNFTYLQAAYPEYPEIYSTFDVFLSMSNLEGGPIPLIEAMMSNAVPVASRTGFAPDLIRNGENGFIFDLDASAERIAKLIEAAFTLPGDIRKTVEKYDWNRFSASIIKLAK
jgi:glycosyltransferase involved in cell wall biosynthesis